MSYFLNIWENTEVFCLLKHFLMFHLLSSKVEYAAMEKWDTSWFSFRNLCCKEQKAA